MKIRNGFVSNSSSSSYIVQIKNTSWEEFCNIMTSSKGFYWAEELRVEIDEEIKKQKKYMSDAKGNKMFKGMKRLYKERLVKLQKLKKNINVPKPNSSILVKTALDFNDVKYYDYQNERIELNYFTSMHNSFNEGMADVLKEIILVFMFDTNKKIKCEREDNE